VILEVLGCAHNPLRYSRYSVDEYGAWTTHIHITLLCGLTRGCGRAAGLLVTACDSVYEDILRTTQHLISLMTMSKEVLWMAVGLLITTRYGHPQDHPAPHIPSNQG